MEIIVCLIRHNTVLLIQYALQGYLTELAIICVDIVKNIVFFVFAYKNLKSNIFVILLFEITVVVLAIITWQNMFSLFLLLASMICTFSYWQKMFCL